jgi:hypothetical protein
MAGFGEHHRYKHTLVNELTMKGEAMRLQTMQRAQIQLPKTHSSCYGIRSSEQSNVLWDMCSRACAGASGLMAGVSSSSEI